MEKSIVTRAMRRSQSYVIDNLGDKLELKQNLEQLLTDKGFINKEKIKFA